MVGSKEYDTVLNRVIDSKIFRVAAGVAFALGIVYGVQHMPSRFDEESDLEATVTQEIVEPEQRYDPPSNPGVRKVTSTINETYLAKIHAEFADSLYTVKDGDTIYSIARKYWKNEHGRNPVSKSDMKSLEETWRNMLDYRRSLGKDTELIYVGEEIDLLP